MKRSSERILTTHVGSLPLLDGNSVAAIVRQQRSLGLDLINEGEYTKGGDWLSYVETRFGGFEARAPEPGAVPLIAQGRDREAFADFYRYASEKGTLFYTPGEQIKRVRQIDDAWLVALWDRIGMPMGLAAFRKRSAMRIEALNHALRNVPEDRVRYHLCWGSWHGPHAFDIELKDVVDLMLRVKAQAYLIEGANARHEHEYAVWDSVKLPQGKILIPGVVTHSTDVVEHPEVVAQRIARYACRVGRENVIAGCDCGFGGRSHPQIAWAKLKALSEGAALASGRLYK